MSQFPEIAEYHSKHEFYVSSIVNIARLQNTGDYVIYNPRALCSTLAALGCHNSGPLGYKYCRPLCYNYYSIYNFILLDLIFHILFIIKVFDLLNRKKKLQILEDSKQLVQVSGYCNYALCASIIDIYVP